MNDNGNREAWEYMTYDLAKPTKDLVDLNRLGRDGWEAVAMVSSWGVGWRWVHPMVLLKRPLADDGRQSMSTLLIYTTVPSDYEAEYPPRACKT